MDNYQSDNINAQYGTQHNGCYQQYGAPSPQSLQQLATKAEKKSLRHEFNISGGGLLLMSGLFLALSFSLSSFELMIFLNSIKDFQNTLSYAINAIVSIVAMFAGGFFILSLNKKRCDDVISFKPTVSAGTVIALIPIAYIFFELSNHLSNYMLLFLQNIGLGFDFSKIWTDTYSGNPIDNMFYVLFISAVPAVSEEFIFRGVMLGTLRKHGDGFAVLVSALTFGIMHGNIVQIPFAFVGGLALGFITVYTNSMLPAMLVHFINNAFSCVSDIVNNEFGEYAANIFQYGLIMVFFILAVIAFIYLSKKDKNVFVLRKAPASLLSFKEKIKCYFFSPTVIIFCVYMALEAALTCIMML